MPVPGWCEDHIASLHGDPFAVDGGEATLAFNDKAHGESSVPVGRGGFIWHHQLKAGVQRVGRVGGI